MPKPPSLAGSMQLVDHRFSPPYRFCGEYLAHVRSAPKRARLLVALEREGGHVSRADLEIVHPAAGFLTETLRRVERHLKFLLWAKGGWRLYLSGPAEVTEAIRDLYAARGRRAFDAEMMSRYYDKPFDVMACAADEVPPHQESAQSIGGGSRGCRVGFDLGASDYKIAAVIDGTPVFTAERPWTPGGERDWQYHYTRIVEGIREAAAHLPRLDAIGGSSAGVFVDNEVKAASLFRSIPEPEFRQNVMGMFKRIGREFGVPLVIVNDGDVTALAGVLESGRRPLLGIAMGSSEAGGYMNRDGRIMGWLNELAFAPVDFASGAPTDEWSGDRGVGAQYFSQQAVNRLAIDAGIELAPDMPLPERLKHVQELLRAGDPAARRVFHTIGHYLGHTLPFYAMYYDFDTVMVLGRVTSGTGGEIILDVAGEVLRNHYAGMSERLTLWLPDEKSRRVGQAVAAARLPDPSAEVAP